jgi:hypothetical protein
MSILTQKILTVVLYIAMMVGLWYLLRHVLLPMIPDWILFWIAAAMLFVAPPFAIVLLVRDKLAARRRAAAVKKDLDNP